MGKFEIKKQVTETIEFADCIKCGSEDISFSDYGYSAFNIAYGRCKGCGHEVSFTCAIFPNKRETIRQWNNGNYIERIESIVIGKAVKLLTPALETTKNIDKLIEELSEATRKAHTESKTLNK